MSKLIVEVNDRHIDKGETGIQFCPVALALSEYMGKKKCVVVTHSRIEFDFRLLNLLSSNNRRLNGKEFIITTRLSEWIHDFDSCRPVQAFELELDTDTKVVDIRIP